ncbi:DUF1918 domain-containing protein [Mycobacterium stomatepiae]|uniref:DUF1918 domain-containing protein n=1 Tax=Mycobacterium stomatepiae TaxID=470076 RepID=A0A7I7QCL4_9MYCO|nr:DUF1918 domain-containing protein [Mycobacterium stomatepiae]MCV7166995.1 DUF1918 domain-containing protein [Mycobacterium stomatepiae]BBY23891.1 hypothetical protein MSTO_40960 [Mycobacterium stomatepiae]
MKANVGDWLVIKGTTTELADQRGLITEVSGAEGAPPFVVRWLDSGHEATVFPGSDAVVVTAAEQRRSDEQVRERVAAMQAELTHRRGDD